MSSKSDISSILSGKPTIELVEESTLFGRLKSFLPQMAEANQQMSEASSADAFQIEKVVEDESSDDSSDDDDSDSEINAEEETKPTPEEEKHIEIDLDVFKEKNSAVDDRDASVQIVDNLPTAFQSEKDPSSPKKVLIEEL